MSIEKRVHQRRDSEQKFYAVVKGKRLVLSAKNLSMGGAFLLTGAIIRPGKILVLQPPVEAGHQAPTCSIAAKVVHFTMLPEFGAGASWVRAMCSEGMRPLRAWMAALLDFEVPDPVAHQLPMTLWDKPLYWDFRRGRFFVDEAILERRRAPREEETMIHGVKVKESLWDQLGKVQVVYSEEGERKRAQRASLGLSPEESVAGMVPSSLPTSGPRRDATVLVAPPVDKKALKRWKKIASKRPETDLPALINRMNMRITGRVRGLDGLGLFIEVAQRPPPPGNRVLVDVKLDYNGMNFPVRFACEIDDVMESPETGIWGIDLHTISVNEGAQRGILKAWMQS